MNVAKPIDLVRARTLSLIGPLAPSLLRDRERRVLVYGLAAIAMAFACTFFAPMMLLAIGPLALGVPHLVADVRYMIVRPGLHRRPLVWLFVIAPALVSFLYPHAWVSMIAIVGAACIARSPIVAFLGLVAVVACFELGSVADLIIAHGHNAIAVALFVLWSRRSGKAYLAIPFAFVIGLVVIGAGVFDHAPAFHLRGSTLLDSDDLLATLAPLRDQTWATRLVLAFAFAQSVHYAVWVRLVPEQDRERPGLRSFGSSLRALCTDLSVPFVVISILVAIGLAIWGAIALTAARDGYLRLAIFHGPLELGAATLLLLERGVIRTKA